MAVFDPVKILERLHYREIREVASADIAITSLVELYDQQIELLNKAVSREGDCALSLPVINYPFVAKYIPRGRPNIPNTSAFGYCRGGEGVYASTVTRLQLFREYLMAQLQLIETAHGPGFFVGLSPSEIPTEFLVRNAACNIDKTRVPTLRDPQAIAKSNRTMTMPDVEHHKVLPLSYFSGLQVDDRLERLAYYTGTSPDDFQQHIIVTNYPMYPELFKHLSTQLMKDDPEYYEFVVPSAMKSDANEQNSRKQPLMPAYHLKRKDKSGVTLVNFGVGPSNASTFIENVAPLRPSLVLMVGHCGGLRGEIQSIGTYILPEGYFRRDRVYDDILPLDQQILPMAEVNIALKKAISAVFNVGDDHLREILQTGTVASTNLRMWEVDPESSVREEIRKSRSLAVDMESAVVAAACTRWAIPFGGLLVISDLPFHGEVKSQNRAHEFYTHAIDNHLKVALDAIDRIRKDAPYVLFSRKLRDLDAPAFR